MRSFGSHFLLNNLFQFIPGLKCMGFLGNFFVKNQWCIKSQRWFNNYTSKGEVEMRIIVTTYLYGIAAQQTERKEANRQLSNNKL